MVEDVAPFLIFPQKYLFLQLLTDENNFMGDQKHNWEFPAPRYGRRIQDIDALER